MDVRQLLAVQIPSYHAQNTPKFRGFTQRGKNMEVSSIRKRIQFYYYIFVKYIFIIYMLCIINIDIFSMILESLTRGRFGTHE
jgi:hypothetical protein